MNGTCVLLSGLGVLLRGGSGSGKSDVALRLIDGGALLVADDQVVVRVEGGRLIATAPQPLVGLLEVRGLGILPVPSVETATIGLVVDLVPPAAVERLPEPESVLILDVSLPRLALWPFEVSATAKLRLAAAAALAGTLCQVPAKLSAFP